MVKIPFAKDLREKYPYAKAGHKKNCTCFVCGITRDEMWAKDNPYEAQVFLENKKAENKKLIELAKAIKSDPKVAQANRDYAITGNKYYKERGEIGYPKDSIHCSTCLQRLGGMSYPCPFGHGYDFIYGKMMNDPSDKRWSLPRYNKSKFVTEYHDSLGHHVERSFAEQQLNERMKDGGNVDDFK